MEEETYGGPQLPRGVKRSRGGWQGEELEMEHQRDASRTGKSKNVAAVQVKQFQNHVVGEGYQARHVIRQKTGNSEAEKILDMTGGSKKEAAVNDTKPASKYNQNTYIQCKGLRDFRREIENILNSA